VWPRLMNADQAVRREGVRNGGDSTADYLVPNNNETSSSDAMLYICQDE
jgi:hypothetical protein